MKKDNDIVGLVETLQYILSYDYFDFDIVIKWFCCDEIEERVCIQIYNRERIVCWDFGEPRYYMIAMFINLKIDIITYIMSHSVQEIVDKLANMINEQIEGYVNNEK